jgi:rhodanese-related sulfurtransferase
LDTNQQGDLVIDSISREELQQAIADGTVTVVETLREEHFADGHLPGAIHLHFDDVVERAPDLIPDRATPIVTYCSNELCRNSDLAALHLVKLGYTNVRRYTEGKQEWVENGLPLERSVVAAR